MGHLTEKNDIFIARQDTKEVLQATKTERLSYQFYVSKQSADIKCSFL